MNFRTVVLCGGSGTRLWPLSRTNNPKQFIKFKNDQTLLDMTLERVKLFKNPKPPILIANVSYEEQIHSTIKKANLDCELIFEPTGKNSAPAIYASTKITKDNESLLIISSDHFFEKPNSLLLEIQDVYNRDIEDNWIILGTKPNLPSTYYGYYKITDQKINEFSKIESFHEKPVEKVAKKYFNSKDYLWNCGIYFVKRNTIINSFNKLAMKQAKLIDSAWKSSKYKNHNKSYYFDFKDYSKLENHSIDTIIFEKSNNLLSFEIKCNWSDIGSWDTFFKKATIKETKNLYSKNSKNNLIFPSERVIATIGIEDLIVVDTYDSTLIMAKDQTQSVKDIFDELQKDQRSEIFKNSVEERPWGSFLNLLVNEHTKVKRLIVKPNGSISTQYHLHRSEHWVVVSGVADVTLDKKEISLNVGDSIDIPRKAIHSLKNNQKIDLIIIEIQIGDYFGEDDIIRLYDPYERES